MNTRLKKQLAVFIYARLALNTGTRMIYPFLAVFARGLGVDITAISMAVMVRASTGVLSPFLGLVSDKYGRKTGMLLGAVIYIIGAALVTIFPTFPVFFVSLSLCFVGMYLYMSAMLAFLGDEVPYEKRGWVMGLQETGWALAFIIGVPLIGLLIGSRGWYAAFPVMTGLGISVFLLLMIAVPNTPPPEATTKNGGSWSTLRMVFTSKPALAALLMSFFFVFSNEVVNLMFGVWMEDTFKLQIAALGASAAIIGLSETGGELGAGWVVDRLGKERSITLSVVVNGLVSFMLPYAGHSLPLAILLLFFLYLSFEFIFVSTLPLVSEILPQARATLMGAQVAAISLGRMAGDFVSPLLYRYGFHVNGLAAMLIDILVLLLLSRVVVTQKEEDVL